MNEVSSLLQNKRTMLGMILLSVLVYTTFHIQENSSALKKITTFESGVQTCFGRVNQTYTAKLLADGASQYLSQNFQSLTEECFAESLMNIDENFKVELALVTKKLSNLASSVHWFHEDLIAPDGEGRDIGLRFEKIENTKDEVLENTDTFKARLSNELGNGKSIFYVTATLLVVVMLLEYLSNAKRNISNNAREVEANRELADNGGIHSVKLGEIVRLALEQNDLKNCAKLFNNFYLHSTFEKSVKLKGKSPLDALITPNSNTSTKLMTEVVSSEKIEKIWDDDTIGIMADNKQLDSVGLSLDNSSSKVIDVLADKLFSKGVQTILNIDENINVAGTDEVLEQVLYHSINFAINASAEADTLNKVVNVNAIKLGDLVAMDILASGAGFDNELLKERAGLEISNSKLDLDLQICQSLISEIGGKMQVDNRLAQNGSVVGLRIKLILKAANNVKSGRLVDVKKGSKKEILAQMNDSYQL